LYALKKDGVLVWWDYATKKKLGEHRFGPPPSYGVPNISFLLHPDGKRILTSHDDDSAYIWDLETQQQICELYTPNPNISGRYYSYPTFSPDGSLVALRRRKNNAIDSEKLVLVFDSETGKEIWRMETPDLVSSVFIFPDNARILIDRNVYEIDPKNPLNHKDILQPAHRFNFAQKNFDVIHLSDDKKQLIITGEIHRTQVFCECDIDTYVMRSEYQLPVYHSPIQLSHDESLMLVVYCRLIDVHPGAIVRCMVMDRKTQQMKKPIRNYSSPVLLAPDNKNLIVGSGNGFSIRDIETDKEIGLLSP
jgi:WD40 repeat protein